MEELEKRILEEGEIRPGGILKVDGFLNHRIDPQLCYDMALELKQLYEGNGINKILTIEASGIAMAIMVAYVFGCPLVFAKKSKTKNISDDVWSVEIESFTHGNTNTVIVSRQYLGPEDRVLIIDDFLATGSALKGLKTLVEQAGGTVVGAGIAIEKAFQGGGDELRREGMRVESLARITKMTDDSIEFVRE
jgi:xanthine phosphoribosyltransferase